MDSQKDIFRHRRFDTPAYLIWVGAKPIVGAKGKPAYMEAVAAEARNVVERAIDQPDVEIEVLYASRGNPNVRADVDNILKPTLDALKGIVYADDRQVRSVTATVFDLDVGAVVAGRVEYYGKLFLSGNPDMLLICVYSDSRLQFLGGEAAIRENRLRDWESRQPGSRTLEPCSAQPLPAAVGRRRWLRAVRRLLGGAVRR